jgi:hypothetical protein
MRVRRALPRVVAIAAGCALVCLACSSGSTVADSAPPLPDPNQERVVFVALGGDETVNRELDDPFRDAWTQRVFTSVLPRSAVYVNFARPGATVAAAEGEQLPQALSLDPTIATVWLGAGDVRAGTTEVAFERDLTDVVSRLHDAGARVLLLSPLSGAGDGDDGRFAEVVDRVVVATNASLVVVPDGDRLLTATQAAIADAVAAHLER